MTQTSYRVMGTTNDLTTCERCGRADLRKTVILAALDMDGNKDGLSYLGSDCAARMLRANGIRVTARDMASTADAADRLMTEARAWAREMGDYYGTVPAAVAIVRYREANRYDTADPAARVASLLAEVETIRSGALTGTRFESRIPAVR